AALAALNTPGGRDGSWYYLHGEAWRLKGVFERAIASYGTAVTKGLPDAGALCRALIRTAACHRALGHEKQAFAFARAAAALSARAPELRAEAELELAMALRLKGDFSRAGTMLERLLRGYTREGDDGAAAFILWALGGLYRLEGRYKDSIKAFRLSMARARKDKDRAAEGYALFGLGGVLRVAGFMATARGAYVRARALFSGTSDVFARAYAECGLANVLRQQGELEAALKGYRRAHALYSSIGDRPDLGFVEWGLGEVYKRRGEFRRAMAAFRKARKLFDGNSEPRGEVLSELSMANLHYLKGRTAEADSLYFRAVAKAKKHGLHTYLETFT
ncbi:MAG TPA: tetratricopeptide repeat protein, partial [Elusimicrobiales bacterium]|nr:tetratricopeptide repeat protein [Elusimicrobiales bacterium]